MNLADLAAFIGLFLQGVVIVASGAAIGAIALIALVVVISKTFE